MTLLVPTLVGEVGLGTAFVESWNGVIQQLAFYNTQVVLYGASLFGAVAGLVGTFAVLRRRALTGDAVAHAALPGVCIAFLVLGERNLWFMLLGALVSGVLGIVIISALVRFTPIREDSAIGCVLSVFPGVGFVLVQLIQTQQFGTTGSKAGLDSFILGKTASMTMVDAHLILGVSLVCLVAVLLLFKEFKVIAFDASFGRSLGWPVYRLDLILMTLVAIAVVIGLPAVGMVLAAAMLILPGASARFWTDSLSWLLFYAAVLGGLIGFLGTLISIAFDALPTGPIIVLTGGAFFTLSLLLGTKRGLIPHWYRQWSLTQKVQEQKLLVALWEVSKKSQQPGGMIPLESCISSRSWSRSEWLTLLVQALRKGWVEQVSGAKKGEVSLWKLSPSGEASACLAAREYRLWQAFLDAYPQESASVAHLSGQTVSQAISPTMALNLQQSLIAQGRWPDPASPNTDAVMTGAV